MSDDTTDVGAVLDERGHKYGSFLETASAAQALKETMQDNNNWGRLDVDMTEALEMIATKIARILNGDPNYADSWIDIAGYAKLVADRLEGNSR